MNRGALLAGSRPRKLDQYQYRESLAPLLRWDRPLRCTCLPNLTRLGLSRHNLARARTRELARRVDWLHFEEDESTKAIRRKATREPLREIVAAEVRDPTTVSFVGV